MQKCLRNLDVRVSVFGRNIVQTLALLGCCAAYVGIV